jgi:hypothetical protein
MATALMVGPLRGKPTITTNSSPTLGDINVYNTTLTGSMSVSLPQLGSGIQTAGAIMLLEKDINDTAATSVTFTCYVGDTFANGSTSLTLTNPGDQRTLEVIAISGVFYWKVIGGLGTGSSTTSVIDDEEGNQFGENPDDVSPVIIFDGQEITVADGEITEATRFGQHLPTDTGYGGYADGGYGYTPSGHVDGLYGYGY